MSSRKGGGKGSYAGTSVGKPSSKGKGIEGSGSGKNNPSVDQMSRDMADVMIDPTDDGEWEVCGKKSKNKGGGGAAKSWGSTTAPRVWGQPEIPKAGLTANGGAPKAPENNWVQAADSRKQAGRGNAKQQSSGRNWESAYMAPPVPSPAVPPSLQHGWQWTARSDSSSQPNPLENEKNRSSVIPGVIPQGGLVGGNDSGTETAVPHNGSDDEDDDDFIEDSDDDFSDECGSDASQKSHETRKKSNWFRAFFEDLDKLTVEQINEPTRQWHCPACKDGPGAIDWYKGLQPLVTHAKTKGSKRVKLHRELAELLEEELQRRGTSVVPAGEVFGKWKGLRETTTTDCEIVWPPMVVIRNTFLEKDENDKWLGMGNQELVEYFSNYAAVRARHSYGPHGHRGMSVLIFEASAVGYLEAERLHRHFAEQGTDKEAWVCRRVLFYPGGKRQLYGYLACKEDMDAFNQHSHGKSRLKFEMRSYQEMVVSQMRQMSEDNQQLIYLKNKVAKQELHKKTLEESFGAVSKKLRETMEENQIVRERTTEQFKENKLEMDYLDGLFKEQMDKIHEATEEKEKHFEKLLQEERAKAKQTDVDSGTKEDHRIRKEEITRFINSQVKGVKEFEMAREQLMRLHEDKKVKMRRRHIEEEVELEKEFDAELTKLMEKYSPSTLGSPVIS